jgi:hypothetical protein
MTDDDELPAGTTLDLQRTDVLMRQLFLLQRMEGQLLPLPRVSNRLGEDVSDRSGELPTLPRVFPQAGRRATGPPRGRKG